MNSVALIVILSIILTIPIILFLKNNMSITQDERKNLMTKSEEQRIKMRENKITDSTIIIGVIAGIFVIYYFNCVREDN